MEERGEEGRGSNWTCVMYIQSQGSTDLECACLVFWLSASVYAHNAGECHLGTSRYSHRIVI